MITNEKVNFLEISTLSTDFCKENYSETAVYWCSIGTLASQKFLKNMHNPSKMQPFDFEKNKIIQMPTWFSKDTLEGKKIRDFVPMKSNKNQAI